MHGHAGARGHTPHQLHHHHHHHQGLHPHHQHAGAGGGHAELGGAGEGAGEVGSLDPFGYLPQPSAAEAARLEDAVAAAAGEETRSLAAARAQAMAPLSRADVPEGYSSVADDERLWSRLNALRSAKVEAEWAVALCLVRLAAMRGHLSHLAAAYEGLKTRIDAIGAERDALASQREVALNDVSLLLRLRMGQDEIVGIEPVTDYSDAMLIPAEAVEAVNADIVSRGRTKVGILSEIRDFRRSLLYMDWERRYLAATARDQAEFFRDVQLMRAMGPVGEFIKGVNVAGRARRELDKASERLAHMRASHGKAMEKLQKSAARLAAHVTEKAAEVRVVARSCVREACPSYLLCSLRCSHAGAGVASRLSCARGAFIRFSTTTLHLHPSTYPLTRIYIVSAAPLSLPHAD